jgi:hypothetical protein
LEATVYFYVKHYRKTHPVYQRLGFCYVNLLYDSPVIGSPRFSFFHSFLPGDMQNIIEAVVQLLRSNIEQTSAPLSNVKCVYWGDPVSIPLSNSPALIVHPLVTDYKRRGTRYDEKIHQIEIRLVYNIKQYVTAGTSTDDPFKVFSVEEAIKAIEQTDGTTMGTQEDSLCGLIQAHPALTFKPRFALDSALPQVASADAKVLNVNYVFNSARGFPTFEIIVKVQVIAIGDRALPS